MAACGTPVGLALEFGLTEEEGTGSGLVTQSVSVTNKSDKKEARDKCGIIASVAYYNKMSDITIEVLGTSTDVVGAALSLTGVYLTLAGSVFVDEVSLEKANEEFVKSTIKATAYEGI